MAAVAAFFLLGLFRQRRRYFEHVNAFDMPNEEFRQRYRLSKNVVRWLCDQLRVDPALRRRRRGRTVMTVEQQVLCALHFFATGRYQGEVAWDQHFAVHQTTVSAAIRAVATAIVNCLGRQWVAFPQTDEEKAATREAFVRRGCLPGVVGCVDGTFVAIKAPSQHDRTVTKALYWCRKHYYALNVMVVCDADMRILAFDPCMPGSTHDSFVWRRSWVRQECVAGRLLEDGEYLLGDEAYPLEPWLLSPVPGRPSLDSPAGRYNIAHASTRAVVERCIRLLKSRFRCLQRPRTLFHHPKIAGTIAAACAVLHNVCLCSEEPEPYPPSDSESDSSSDDEDETSDAAEERISVQSRCLYARGKAVRDRLVLTPCTSHLRRVRRRFHSLHPRRPH